MAPSRLELKCQELNFSPIFQNRIIRGWSYNMIVLYNYQYLLFPIAVSLHPDYVSVLVVKPSKKRKPRSTKRDNLPLENIFIAYLNLA